MAAPGQAQSQRHACQTRAGNGHLNANSLHEAKTRRAMSTLRQMG